MKMDSINNTDTEEKFIRTMMELSKVETDKPIMRALLQNAPKKMRNGVIKAKK